MASDPERKTGPEARATTVSEPPERPRKKKSKRPKPPIPRSEQEIDSPHRQTLGMLGVLAGLTLVMHVFARGACNYHPPKESRNPRVVTTAELAHDPKQAAIEAQQRWATLDFDGALELAAGATADDIRKDKAACGAACLAARSELKKSVLTTSVLLEQSPLFASVRVTSSGLPGGAKTYLLRLERADAIWKVTSRVPSSEPPPSPVNLAAPSPATADPHAGMGIDPHSGTAADPHAGMGVDPHSGTAVDPHAQ